MLLHVPLWVLTQIMFCCFHYCMYCLLAQIFIVYHYFVFPSSAQASSYVWGKKYRVPKKNTWIGFQSFVLDSSFWKHPSERFFICKIELGIYLIPEAAKLQQKIYFLLDFTSTNCMITDYRFHNYKKYQPSGEGGTCSPQRLQNPIWPPKSGQ